MRYFLILIFVLPASVLLGQKHWCDSLAVEAEASLSVASNADMNPLWLYSNEWGRFTQFDQGEANVYVKAAYRIANFRHFTLNAGLAVQASSDGNTPYDDSHSVGNHVMLHEAYLSGKVLVFDYTVGRECQRTLAGNDDLVSGKYLMSSNARPIPRVGVGIFDYWGVPYTRNWLEVRGAFYVGWMPNEDDPVFTKDALLHEKYAYARIGGWYLKPYFGLVHNVMMGGTYNNGVEIPLEFWRSFLGKGAKTIDHLEGGFLRGEATNALGAHQGVWDLGFDFDFRGNSGTVYFQRIFKDRGGTNLFSRAHSDFLLGGTLRMPTKVVSAVGMEYFKSSNQAGEGPADPVGYDKNGEFMLIYPGDVAEDGWLDWVYEHFTQEDIDAFEASEGKLTYDELTAFLRYTFGNGEYSGRKNYLNNGLYPQGWSVGGLSLGTPLFHSRLLVDRYNTEGKNSPNQSFFVNNAVEAFTISLKGNPTPKFSYALKYTYSCNHGSLCEKYATWMGLTTVENYIFEEKKVESYTKLSLSYKLNESFDLSTVVAYDFGELYDSFGLRIACKYSF